MIILPHHVSCSVLLAAALRRVFPAAQVIDFQATEKCFFADVVSPFPFDDLAIRTLEDQMRAMVRKNFKFQLSEMVAANANEFLRHLGQPLIQDEGLVEIVQVDGFAGKAPGTPLPSTGEIEFFKLVRVVPYGKRTRLIGVSDKTEAKAWKEVSFQIPENLLEQTERGWIWLPKKQFFDTARSLFSGLREITTPALSASEMAKYHAQYPGSYEFLKTAFPEGGNELFNPPVGTTVQAFLPLTEENTISFLQTIIKFLTIYPFDYEVVLIGKSGKIFREGLERLSIKYRVGRGETGIEFRIKDLLGRSWVGPRLWIDAKEKVVICSLFHSVERFMALQERVSFSKVR